jgi:hypothetical protein
VDLGVFVASVIVIILLLPLGTDSMMPAMVAGNTPVLAFKSDCEPRPAWHETDPLET